MAPPRRWFAAVTACAVIVIAVSCSTAQGRLVRTWLADLPINRWPVVQAHDAATGYLHSSNFVEKIVYDWTRTQVCCRVDSAGCVCLCVSRVGCGSLPCDAWADILSLPHR